MAMHLLSVDEHCSFWKPTRACSYEISILYRYTRRYGSFREPDRTAFDDKIALADERPVYFLGLRFRRHPHLTA